MQDRYAGDFGDFVKLALLRTLTFGHRLGVVWYRVNSESHNGDGRHILYLRDLKWRSLNPEVFDGLSSMVQQGARSVPSLERLSLLPGCQFASEFIPLSDQFVERPIAKAKWLSAAIQKVSGCDFVFLDPDNGLEAEGFRPTSKTSIKYTTLTDLNAFAQTGRTLMLYHHQSRRPGGHINEIAHVAQRIRNSGFKRVDAIRAGSYSPRVFFLVDGSDELRSRAQSFAKDWAAARISWHQDP